MEAHLVHSGAVVLKFWLHIDKDEQERRFNDRMKNPEKQWKITDEDWRNREKWDQYEEAVNEMLEKLMTKAFAALYETTQEKHCTLRMGAYVVALQRLIDAEVIKGLFP